MRRGVSHELLATETTESAERGLVLQGMQACAETGTSDGGGGGFAGAEAKKRARAKLNVFGATTKGMTGKGKTKETGEIKGGFQGRI